MKSNLVTQDRNPTACNSGKTGIFQNLHDKLKLDLFEDGDGDGAIFTLCLLQEFADAERFQPTLLADMRRLIAEAQARLEQQGATAPSSLVARGRDLADRLAQADNHADVVGAPPERRARLRRQAVGAHRAAHGLPKGDLVIDAPVLGVA